ncbi:MAG: hypothetical protein AAGH40_14200 [Verrucomicrobiota bacterium]
MNKEFDTIIDKVEKEIAEASIHFELFLSLFGSLENLQVVNKSAPNVFLCFKQTLVDSSIIKLCRLLDPAEKGKNKNIGIDLLIDYFDDEPEFQELLKEKRKAVEAHVTELRPYRHKRLAHNDLETHQENRHDIIGNRFIDAALNELQDLVNIIRNKKYGFEVHILNQEYPLQDGPERLMKLLRRGIDANQPR